MSARLGSTYASHIGVGSKILFERYCSSVFFNALHSVVCAFVKHPAYRKKTPQARTIKLGVQVSIFRPSHRWSLMMKNEAEFKLSDGSDVDCKIIRVVRVKGLVEMISVSRSTLYDWMNPASPRYDPTFPRSRPLSKKGVAVGWLESEVVAWIKDKFL
jgi:prophage regulatory protein